MGGSRRRRGRFGMTVAGMLVSVVVSTHEGGDNKDETAGRVVTELIVVESLGSVRNLAGLLFLIPKVSEFLARAEK